MSEKRNREELPICPECSIPLEIKKGSYPFCKHCCISWEVEIKDLPTEYYWDGDDRSKAQ